MEPLLDLLGVPFVVELQEPVEDFPAGRLADREPSPLLGFVEAVAEVEVSPAVGGDDGLDPSRRGGLGASEYRQRTGHNHGIDCKSS